MDQLRRFLELQYDRWKLLRLKRHFGPRLHLDAPECSAFGRTDLRIAEGGRVRIGAHSITERRRANQIWLHANAELDIGERVWLRTEYAENQLTLFPGARIRIGRHGLLNGAMLHAKTAIDIGEDARIGFGVRILDADLHDLDQQTRERAAPVCIGDRVWLAANVLVLRGVTIGDDVVVAAGSVVSRDLPARVLAAGTPARPIRPIDSRVDCR